MKCFIIIFGVAKGNGMEISMKNLMRYNYYRTRHNMLSYLILLICCVIAFVFTDESYLTDPIVVNTPQSLTGVFMNEVADAGIANILIVGCYVTFEFAGNLKQRCINYELISGNSRNKVFISHYAYSFILSGSMITVSLLVGCCKYGLTDWVITIWNNIAYFLRSILFIYILSFSIISMCMIFAVLFKDTAKSTIVTFVFLFLSCYIMAAIASAISGNSIVSAYEEPPLALLFYPPYLWRWILNPELQMSQLLGVVTVAVLWCGSAFAIGNYFFEKME